MISREQAEKIRQALISQINSMSLSDEEKATAIEQVNLMPEDKLEEFVKPSCVFCNIVSGKAESFKVMENKDAVVVLEINPMSKGHSILIPKAHISLQEFTESVYELLRKTIKQLSKVMVPKQISITSSETSGHSVINIMPLFSKETGKREKAEASQLEALAEMLKEEEKPKKEAKERETKEKKESKEKEKISEPEIVIEQMPVRVP